MRGDRIDRAEQQIVIPEEFMPFPAHFGALLVEGKPFPMKQRIAAQRTRLGSLIIGIEGPSGAEIFRKLLVGLPMRRRAAQQHQEHLMNPSHVEIRTSLVADLYFFLGKE